MSENLSSGLPPRLGQQVPKVLIGPAVCCGLVSQSGAGLLWSYSECQPMGNSLAGFSSGTVKDREMILTEPGPVQELSLKQVLTRSGGSPSAPGRVGTTCGSDEAAAVVVM